MQVQDSTQPAGFGGIYGQLRGRAYTYPQLCFNGSHTICENSLLIVNSDENGGMGACLQKKFLRDNTLYNIGKRPFAE